MRLVKILWGVWSSYSFADAFWLTVAYVRVLFENRLSSSLKTRLLSLEIVYPSRRAFFSQFTELFLQRVYQPSRSCTFIIDCGANIGMSALYFAWQCPKAEILCFEPNPSAFEFLSRNLEHNGLVRVRALPYAVGKEDTTATLFIEPTVTTSTGASIVDAPSRVGFTRVPVEVRRLSPYVTKTVDYLKLDVEGAEHEVVQELQISGALKHVRALCVECHKKETSAEDTAAKIKAILESEGFTVAIRPAPMSSQTVILDAMQPFA